MKKQIWIMNHYAGSTFVDKGGRHYTFAKYLKRMGHEPTVFCCNAKHSSQAELYFEDNALWQEHYAEDIDVPFVFIRGRAYSGNGKQRVLNMVDFYRNVKKAAKEYAKLHGAPDIIFASSVHPLTLVAGIQLAKHFGIKCICEVRDLWPESLVAYGMAGPKNPAVLLLRRLEKWIYRKSDAIVFTMEGAYDYIIEQGWEKEIPRSKVHFINNGVDLDVFDYNKAHYQVEDPDLENPDIFKVVYTGSIRKANSVGLLLDAAKQIKNPNIRFLIWGAGDELEYLMERVEKERITNVVFKGRVDKKYVPYIICHSDLNMIDKFDGELAKYGISANKMFEYFAAEKPIVMVRLEKYNPAGDSTGVISYDGSASSLAQVISDAFEIDCSQYSDMCASVSQCAEAYSFERLTCALLRIIEDIDC